MDVAGLLPDPSWRRINLLLWGGFAASLAGLLAAAALWSEYLPVLPVALAGLWVAGWAVREELRLLAAVIAGFVLAAGYGAGFQPGEIAYGLIYLSYLSYWFVTRILVYRMRLLVSATDWALAIFLAYATASFGLTWLFGGELTTAVSEWLALSMLAFYFPVKEACARHEGGVKAIAGAAFLVGIYIVLRNAHTYWTKFVQSTELWQMAVVRVTENEHLLMMLAIVAFVGLLFAPRPLLRTVYLSLFVAFAAGTVVGLSRALWVSALVGILAVFILVDRRQKRTMLKAGAIGGVLLLTIGLIFFQDLLWIITAGLVDRFSTLTTAVSTDVSLRNRFLENKAVWAQILKNPIVGYGLGTPYHYYSMVYEATHEVSFIHNGYLSVWYHLGLPGVAAMFVFYGGSMWRGIRLSRVSPRGLSMAVGIAVFAAMLAESIVAVTESPFATSEKTFMLALLAGAAAGRWERTGSHSTGPPENDAV